MRMTLSIIGCIVTLMGNLKAQPLFFEKYIDVTTGKEAFVCNHSLCFHSLNGVFVELEPYVSAQNSVLIVNGFSVYLPEDLTWIGKKPVMELETLSGKIIRFNRSIYDKDNRELFFYLTKELFIALRFDPVRRLTISNKKNKLTSLEMITQFEQDYFVNALDQFAYQIYDYINWLNPYYYDD